MTDVVAALVSFLAADSGVAAQVGSRVYGEELPPDDSQSMPRSALVIRSSGGVGIGAGVRDYMPVGSQRVDMLCYGATAVSAMAVRLAVYSAMKAIGSVVQDTVLIYWAASAGGPTYLRDADTDWPLVLEPWQVFAAETAVT